MVCQDRGEDTIGQLRSLLATEHETRRRLHTQVRASFSTPLAAEDLFELTERLGAVSERAYGVAREAELSRTAPDPRLGQQVEAIAAAMTPLGAAIRALPDSHAAPLADQALEQLTLAEHDIARRSPILSQKPTYAASCDGANSIAGANSSPRQSSTWHGAPGTRCTSRSKTSKAGRRF